MIGVGSMLSNARGSCLRPVVKDQGSATRRVARYRQDYAAYYQSFADAGSPKLRDANPAVVVIPTLGLFGFSKDKREAPATTPRSDHRR